MFAHRPVTGWWRHSDQLQLVSAPPDAPRPPVIMGDHPLIVDIAFKASIDWQVRNHRMAVRSYQVRLLLNLLVRSGVSMPTNRGRSRWVCKPIDLDGPPVLWTNSGYFIPDFTFVVDAMPAEASGPRLQTLPAIDYYDVPGGLRDELALPAEFDVLVTAYDDLTGDDRRRFDRALYWYAAATDVWDISQSLHLTSLVNAVECMSSIETDRSDPTGPTRLFKDFLRAHGPGRPGAKRIDAIYGLRSSVTHGSVLLAYDRPGQSAYLDQASSEHRQAGDDAQRLTRGALLNWLWSKRPEADSAQLLTIGLPTSAPAKPGTTSKVQILVPGATGSDDGG